MPSAWPRRLRGPAPAPPRTTRSLVLRRPPRRALRPRPAGGTPRPAPPAVALGAPAASNAPGDRAGRTTRTAPDKYAAPARFSSPTSNRAGAATAPSRDDLRRRRPPTRRPPASPPAGGGEPLAPYIGRCSPTADGPTSPSRPFPPGPTGES